MVSRISTECFLDFVGCQVKQIQVILHWKVFLEAIFETDITCTKLAHIIYLSTVNKGLYDVLIRLFYFWPSWWLTKTFPGPPVWLLHRVELDLWVQQQPVEQVSGAAFWLADDVKEGQAAEAEQAALPED